MLRYTETEPLVLRRDVFDEDDSTMVYIVGVLAGETWHFRAYVSGDDTPLYDLTIGEMVTEQTTGLADAAIAAATAWITESCGHIGLIAQVIDSFSTHDSAMAVFGVSPPVDCVFALVEGKAKEEFEKWKEATGP